MTQEDFESQFIDYLEGKLTAEETARFEAELAKNQTLRTSFEEYSKIVEAERLIAGESHSLHPNFSVKVMDSLPAEQGFFERLYMYFTENRRLVYSSLATCATLVVVLTITNRPIPDKLDMQLRQAREKAALVEVERHSNAAVVPQEVGGLQPSKDSSSFKKLDEIGRHIDEQLVKRGAPEAAAAAPVVPQSRQELFSDKSVQPEGRLGGAADSRSRQALAKNEQERSVMKTKEAYVSQGSASLEDRVGVQGIAQPGLALEGASGELAVDLSAPKIPSSYRRVEPPTEFKPQRPNSAAAWALKEPAALRNQLPVQSLSSTLNESYISVAENKRTLVREEPVSTFSIDVDTASYANARRFISAGQLPPAEAVRVEEFLNYFDYNYPVQYDKPFTLSYEIAPSPLEREKFLLKLGVKARDAKPTDKGWNLVLLVDVSGSMSDSNKLPLLKRALPVLVEGMRPQDKISIVTYAGSAGIALPPTSGTEKFRILNAIDNLSPGGSTNGAGGISIAYNLAQQVKIDGGVNRVILMTDGDFNVGITSHDELIRLIEEKRRRGITLTTIGVGQGNLKDGTIEQLANKGNGNYFYLDSFKEARKVLQTDLVGNMEVVAKDVKLQVEFNPEQVVQYRLVGYDNRRLNKQDFNNDAIDAGEIGTGHTVTALYEVVLTDSEAANRLKEELRYQKAVEARKIEVPEDKRAELAFLKIRYKNPEEDRSNLLEYPVAASDVRKDVAQTSDDFRFAAAVSYFGTLLRRSEFAGKYTFPEIAALAQGAKGADSKGYRQEFIEMVKDAAALSGRSPVIVDRGGAFEQNQ